jgi:hypothetical protein
MLLRLVTKRDCGKLLGPVVAGIEEKADEVEIVDLKRSHNFLL